MSLRAFCRKIKSPLNERENTSFIDPCYDGISVFRVSSRNSLTFNLDALRDPGNKCTVLALFYRTLCDYPYVKLCLKVMFLENKGKNIAIDQRRGL